MTWTDSDRTEFSRDYVATSKFYDKDVSYELARIVVHDLQDLDFAACMAALSAYRKDSKNRFWPKPADVRDLVIPRVDNKLAAIALAAKIDKAIKNHGHVWADGYYAASGNYFLDHKNERHDSFKSAVVSELGAIGWQVILERGGWSSLRNSANEMDQQGFIAQLRDHINATIVLNKQGVDVAQIECEEKRQVTASSKITNLVNFALFKQK